MGEVVNLRLKRKRSARRAAEAVADENRVAHGLPKATRRLAALEAAARTARLNGLKLHGRADGGSGASDAPVHRPDDTR